MTSFQRARSEDQREQRREAILDAAAAMLSEMSVNDLTLNELSRRVGLAKSNVLRYFVSREAVLLELLHRAYRDWVADLAQTLPSAVGSGPLEVRVDRTAAVLTSSVAGRPVLCDLWSAQTGVLERNISADVAARFKRSALDDTSAFGREIVRVVPELGEQDGLRFAAAAAMIFGAAWTHGRPSPAMQAAYDADPALAVLSIGFTDTARQLLEVLLSGLLARSATQVGGRAAGA
ncbi:TetR/AcrR family transcriptional regulator [Nakamurella endophytica]|uniref:TetR family transcriptional regulator n=1 Tax=Nakamurella endophytica TaxID=1748367 RepID=A0A917SVU2_9ACTN|nr:TetR/AcrR family transcriptional regulator [Nakamurella endophytica]GGL98998.1 TetR family transcriptional regulator [Nakamurella endophytica]